MVGIVEDGYGIFYLDGAFKCFHNPVEYFQVCIIIISIKEQAGKLALIKGIVLKVASDMKCQKCNFIIVDPNMTLFKQLLGYKDGDVINKGTSLEVRI